MPPAERERLVRAWRRHQTTRVDAAGERDRLQLLILEGDLDRAAYQVQKSDLQAQLAALPANRSVGDGIGQRLADYLADVALAWREGTPEERNKLARELFSEVVVDNRTAVAVTPRPDLYPFFASVACQTSDEVTYGRKRRDSNPRSQP